MKASMPRSLFGVMLVGALCGGTAAARTKAKPVAPTPLDRYVSESAARPGDAKLASPGSLGSPASRLADADSAIALPSGAYLAAFSNRLINTCSTSTLSSGTSGKSTGRFVVTG